MIDFNCPTCDKRFHVPDTFTGKNGTCPKCKTRISIRKAEPDLKQVTPTFSNNEAISIEVSKFKSGSAISSDQKTLCVNSESILPNLTAPIAAPKRKRIVFVLGMFGLLVLIIYIANYANLQSEINSVIQKDYRNSGIKVSVHYSNYINPSVLVYDLREISGNNSMVDVFRVFLQFAATVKNKEFDSIELSHKGRIRYKIRGSYFQKLGEEYNSQNPLYTTRTFPENVLNPDGSRAFSEWEGGILGVSLRQMEDFAEFHKRWYLNDL